MNCCFRYSKAKYISVVLITIGIAASTIASSQHVKHVPSKDEVGTQGFKASCTSWIKTLWSQWWLTYLPCLAFLHCNWIICFYAPGLKGPPGASINPIIRPSVRNSVPLTNKVQYLKFLWWYSDQTWTVSSSMGSSHFTDITCPWEWGWVKM